MQIVVVLAQVNVINGSQAEITDCIDQITNLRMRCRQLDGTDADMDVLL